jgi:hypothetical protein
MRRDALGVGTAALGARRAAVRLCVDARGLRRASVHVGTDAPFIPTDALRTRRGILLSTDGRSASSQRRPRRSTGSSIWRRRRPMRTSGRSGRSSGCSRGSRGRRAKARAGFARSHASIVHFSPCRLHFGSSGADARSGPHHARCPFVRTSGRRRWDSRRPTRRGRRPR